MRIDAYNQITQIYGVQKSMKTSKTQSTSGFSDQLSISRAGRDYQVAKNAVSEASDVREDKVAQLKSMVDSGTYEVSAGDFASKLLEKYGAVM
jgi:negative regulator of flagellin synthesis FlgM